MINNRLSSFFIRKSVIFYCVCISLAPEKKKQAESAVRYRVSEAASAPESSGDSLNLYSAAYGWQQIDQIQSQSNDCSHGLCFYVIF